MGKLPNFSKNSKTCKIGVDPYGRDFDEASGRLATALDFEGRVASSGDFPACAIPSCLSRLFTSAGDVELFPAWVVSTR
jgi:hypothetical protein